MRTLTLLLLGLSLASCHEGLGDPPPSNGLREERLVTPVENETCSEAPLHFTPPLALLETHDVDCEAGHTWCFRLAADLREVAARRDPLAALGRAADAFDEDLREPDPLVRARALAFADLSVTGSESWAAFVELAPQARDVPSSADEAAIALAVDRAYEVAWALRGPASHRVAARDELGWIAVSPEDDLPDRPVNVRGAPYPVFDLTVSVPLPDGSARSVRARMLAASTVANDDPVVPESRTGALPPEVAARIPKTGDILLYVHGHSSRIEEAVPLAGALLDEYRERGVDATLLAVELPSNGYSERIDPEEILASATSRDAVLSFYDAFLVSVVERLEEIEPGSSARITAVLGGSLGGNLALRMAEQIADRAWPERAVVWSPVSIDYSWLRARWPFAAGDGEFVDIVKHEAVRMTDDASREAEDDSSREDFFTAGFTAVEKQSEYWYRSEWQPCRDRAVAAGLAQLGEVYDSRLRRFHYRVAYEQLVFSHIEEDENGTLRFERIEMPLLLATGEADDQMPMSTWSFVDRLAPFLTAPGPTLFFEDTGHTIHTERPRLLADEIAAFLVDG